MRDFITPRWRKVLRDALLHKARTLLVIVAIATAMTGAGALLDAWALVQRVTAQTYLGSHPVSATLHVQHVDAALLASVPAFCHCELNPKIDGVGAGKIWFFVFEST